jgi:hypothetical protein
MIVKRPGLLSLAAALALTAGFAAPSQAADRSDVLQPINCDGGDIECLDVGESRLLRSADGLVATVVTSRLRKGHAYSLWWVIFNNPEVCDPEPCGLEDLENEEAGGTAIWASGLVAGDFGTGQRASGHFTAVLNQGEGAPGSEIVLEDPEAADVLLVVRSQGRAKSHIVGDQMTSFDDGCDIDITPSVPKKKGECANVQFAVHSVESVPE